MNIYKLLQHFIDKVLPKKRRLLARCSPRLVRVLLKLLIQDFPGSPVVKTLPSNAGDVGSIPGQGTKVLHAMGCSKKKKKSAYSIQ